MYKSIHKIWYYGVVGDLPSFSSYLGRRRWCALGSTESQVENQDEEERSCIVVAAQEPQGALHCAIKYASSDDECTIECRTSPEVQGTLATNPQGR